MSNEENPEQQHYGQPGPYDGWQPTPQSGEYDAEATAFVHLPPEDLANIPLAAPGHGYVPPMIVPLTPAAGLDPAATGSWVVQPQGRQDQAAADHAPPEAVHWPDPNQQYEETSSITAGSTAQWDFSETVSRAPEPHTPEPHTPGGYDGQAGEHGDYSGHSGQSVPAETSGGHTGQWTIPVADGDLPEESGEFAASALASQWHPDALRPATLPGGAAAPWATQQPEPEQESAHEPEPAHEPEHEPEPAHEPEHEPEPAHEPERERAPEHDPRTGPEPEGATAGPQGDTAADAPEALRAPEVPATGDAATGDPAEAGPATDAPDPIGPTAASEASDNALSGIGHLPAPAGTQDTPELAPDPARIDVPSEHPEASYVLTVNGVDRPVGDAWIGESLLYVLRERLGLAGAKDGCSQGECGACNVQVDGRLVASCLVPAATAAGSEVRTVEGLAVDGEPSDVQRALADCGAVQCGFCIPGMAMTVHDLLEGNHAPSELETRQALCGNLCRCSGYRGVLDAVREVVAGREALADATAPDAEEARIPHQASPGAGSVQVHPSEGDAR